MIIVMTENDCFFAPPLKQVKGLDVTAWIDAPEVVMKNDRLIMFAQGTMAWIRAIIKVEYETSKDKLIAKMEEEDDK